MATITLKAANVQVFFKSVLHNFNACRKARATSSGGYELNRSANGRRVVSPIRFPPGAHTIVGTGKLSGCIGWLPLPSPPIRASAQMTCVTILMSASVWNIDELVPT